MRPDSNRVLGDFLWQRLSQVKGLDDRQRSDSQIGNPGTRTGTGCD